MSLAIAQLFARQVRIKPDAPTARPRERERI
jgi:hypothetical protein